MFVRLVEMAYRIPPHIGQHNDSRMNIALVMTAVQQGAVVANHVEVTSLHKDTAATGKLYGARVQDKLTGQEWDVRAKVKYHATFDPHVYSCQC